MARLYTSIGKASDKELLREYNNKLMRLFKAKESQSNQLALFHPSVLPGKLNQSTLTHYEKRRLSFPRNLHASLDIITKNHKFDSFVWHTTPEKLKLATRYGIVKTYSITGKTISALGKYRLITAERIALGFVSNRYAIKEALLNLFQDRINALQLLESLITLDIDANIVNAQLTLYIETLKAIQTKVSNLMEVAADSNVAYFSTEFDSLDPNGRSHITSKITEDIQAAEALRLQANQEPPTHLLKPTGPQSLLTFVKKRLYRHLREMQNLNQNITYSTQQTYAATRGDLNSCIEDAARAISTHKADHHNAIQNDHHGTCHDSDSALQYDSSKQGLTQEECEKSLLAISFIEERNRIDLSQKRIIRDTDLTDKNGKPLSDQLKIVKTTKWSSNGNWKITIEKTLKWFPNIFIRLTTGVLDLVLFSWVHAINYGLSSFYKKSPTLVAICDSLNKIANFKLKTKQPEHIIDLRKEAHQTMKSFGMRLGHFLVTLLKNSIWDLFKGVRDAGKELSLGLYYDIQNDLQEGKLQTESNGLYASLEKELEYIKNNNKIQLKKALHVLNQQAQKQSEKSGTPFNAFPDPDTVDADLKTLSEKMIAPAYLPGDGEWDDIFNASAYGFDEFMALFMHNIYTKHPATGLLFTGAFAAGGFAVIAPQLLPAFLQGGFKTFSIQMADAMAKGSLEGAIASGSTLAELCAAAWELLINGPKSWLITGFKQFAHDPATAVAYLGLAYGFGAILLFGGIPLLSEALLEAQGTVAAATILFAGAKLGVLIFELLHTPNHESLLDSDAAIKLKTAFDEFLQKTHPNLDAQTKHELIAQFLNDTINRIQSDPRIRLLALVQQNRDTIHLLSANMKRRLGNEIHRIFPSSYQANSLLKLLHPEETRSILQQTLHITFSLIALAIRIPLVILGTLINTILGNISFNRIHKPLLHVLSAARTEILKDTARLYRAASKVFKTNMEFIRVMCKSKMDVIGNSILARAETITKGLISLLTGKQFYPHHIGNKMYQVSANLDAAYEHARQASSTVIDPIIKRVTSPDIADTNQKISTAVIRMQLDHTKLTQNAQNVISSTSPITKINVTEKNKQNDMMQENIKKTMSATQKEQFNQIMPKDIDKANQQEEQKTERRNQMS